MRRLLPGGASGARRVGALTLAIIMAGCATRPAAAPSSEPGVDRLSATTAAVAAASIQAVEEAPDSPAPRGAGDGPQVREGSTVSGPATAPMVDDSRAALAYLATRRAAALADTQSHAPELRVRELTHLGLWDDAGRLVAAERAAGRGTPALAAAEGALLRKRHRYGDAQRVIANALRSAPDDPALAVASGWIEVDRWRLDSASAAAARVLRQQPGNVPALELLGRVQLLEKRYDEALGTALRLQQSGGAAGYLLEADVHFWREEPARAEAPLRKALERDPFDPDARFAYGYAIWRRVDARQLGAMAAQWNLALAVDPLHYITHWHYGNGHTDRTYADYAMPSDSLVRERLKRADSLIADDRTQDAIALSRSIEREFPESVLPAMLRGSAFYMAYTMDREARLDSAQATFAGILARLRNYGPAHNGLAAVIKQRQVGVLAAFDSLEQVIANTPLPPDPAFDSVFADLRQYPGDRVLRMARAQMGPSVAYLPMLARQGKTFHVPPLHHDLADAMDRKYFRGATTFDNRQWMDIRGVGSGAAGLEYVERGAHWERNVLAHEYVHLFHGRALTDAQSRRVRRLYWNAMRDNATLDYYASNNESEFLAQAYEAYLSPVKAHPLNHKSMNVRADLARKDPATYEFVEELVRRENASLAGDTTILASNWAQAYANVADSLRGLWLSDSARSSRAADSARLVRRTDDDSARRALADTVARRADTLRVKLAEAAALLDTALIWDPRYIPAMLSYAQLRREELRFDDAERLLARAQATDSSYAPTYAARAVLLARRTAAERASGSSSPPLERASAAEQAALYERALALETDLALRASLSGALRGLYRQLARVPEALQTADSYVASAPMVSTYLRDTRDGAAAFAASLRAEAGYSAGALVFFDSLAPLKPQNWGLREQQIVALWRAGRADDALAQIASAQRILSAGAGASGGLASLEAEIRLSMGDSAGARTALSPLLDLRVKPRPNDRRIVRALAMLGHPDSAARRHASYRDDMDGPLDRAVAAYTRGVIAEARGDGLAAESEYRAALADDPYQRDARVRLVRMLRRADRATAADAVAAEADRLPLPAGPDLQRDLNPDGRTRAISRGLERELTGDTGSASSGEVCNAN